MRALSIAKAIACAGLSTLSCGGAGPASRSAAEAEREGERSASAEADAAGEGASAPEPPPPRCTDGTCFPCGDGYCPTGFYCDEGAVGGAACAWLPGCGAESRCPCLEKALPGCRCEAEGGAVRVR